MLSYIKESKGGGKFVTLISLLKPPRAILVCSTSVQFFCSPWHMPLIRVKYAESTQFEHLTQFKLTKLTK